MNISWKDIQFYVSKFAMANLMWVKVLLFLWFFKFNFFFIFLNKKYLKKTTTVIKIRFPGPSQITHVWDFLFPF